MGLVLVPPVGPEIPVVEIDTSDFVNNLIPLAISIATSLLTAPYLSRVLLLTFNISFLTLLLYATIPPKKYFDEPGKSVIFFEIKPPVHDSAIDNFKFKFINFFATTSSSVSPQSL